MMYAILNINIKQHVSQCKIGFKQTSQTLLCNTYHKDKQYLRKCGTGSLKVMNVQTHDLRNNHILLKILISLRQVQV